MFLLNLDTEVIKYTVTSFEARKNCGILQVYDHYNSLDLADGELSGKKMGKLLGGRMKFPRANEYDLGFDVHETEHALAAEASLACLD